MENRLVIRYAPICELNYRGTGAGQEFGLFLTWFDAQRLAEARRAGNRHDQHASLRQDALKVVEMDRHQIDIRKTAGEAIDAAAKRGDLIGGASRPLRKNQDRTAFLEQALERLQRIAVRRRLAVYQDGAQASLRDEAAKSARSPIVARRNRVGQPAHRPRQGGHDGDGIDMAVVIGEIDAADGIGRAAPPLASGADQDADEQHEKPTNERDHSLSKECFSLNVRVMQVTRLPAAMMADARISDQWVVDIAVSML